MECPYAASIGISEFYRRLGARRKPEERWPFNASIEVTERCNLQCAHCFINQPAGHREIRARELTTSEWFHVLDQMADAGCMWLLLTGGEPFVRPDFLDIYTHAKKRGLLNTIFTNGTTITPQIADYLAEWPPVTIEISLYGATQETYEQVTRVPGSYKRCIEGIELLVERRLDLKLKAPLMAINRHELGEMELFAERFGTNFRFDPVLNPRIDGNLTPLEFRLPVDDVVALDLADPKRLEDWRQFCATFYGPPPDSEHIFQCGAGRNTFHVDAYGRMSVCMMARSPSYDLRRGGFSEGWETFFSEILAQRWTQDTPCKSCRLSAICGQCPGWAQMETGDQEQPVAFLCQLAHRRARLFEQMGYIQREAVT